MQIETLRELAIECITNQNYHFRALTLEQVDEASLKSFKRLPPAQQNKVAESWKAAIADELEKKHETFSDVHLKEALRYRFLAQTNLYFLCKLLEKYNRVTINTHEDICNKFFVQKDPSFATFEKFANQYTDLKERLLLVPRGGFKSSIDIAIIPRSSTWYRSIVPLLPLLPLGERRPRRWCRSGCASRSSSPTSAGANGGSI